MTTRKTLLTAEDLAAMPDDGCHRYELVRGELRERPFAFEREGEVTSQCAYLLGNWTWAARTGRAMNGAGVLLERGPDTVRAPDIAFISRERRRAIGLRYGFLAAAPDLIVEVISPDDSAREIAEKTAQWLAAGALLVWNVYPDRGEVEAFWTDGRRRTYMASDTLDAEPVLPGFGVPVAELFALPDDDEE